MANAAADVCGTITGADDTMRREFVCARPYVIRLTVRPHADQTGTVRDGGTSETALLTLPEPAGDASAPPSGGGGGGSRHGSGQGSSQAHLLQQDALSETGSSHTASGEAADQAGGVASRGTINLGGPPSPPPPAAAAAAGNGQRQQSARTP